MEIAIIIASCYGLLAIMGGSTSTLMAESIFIAAFVAMAIFGFKLNLWLVVAALFAHGVFDFVHAHLIQNRGVPVWWPGFCLADDSVAAGYLAWNHPAEPRRPSEDSVASTSVDSGYACTITARRPEEKDEAPELGRGADRVGCIGAGEADDQVRFRVG